MRGAAEKSSRIILCRLPSRHASNTTGLIYDFLHTAGVLRNSIATCLIAATMQAFSADSPSTTGNEVEDIRAIARNVRMSTSRR